MTRDKLNCVLRKRYVLRFANKIIRARARVYTENVYSSAWFSLPIISASRRSPQDNITWPKLEDINRVVNSKQLKRRNNCLRNRAHILQFHAVRFSVSREQLVLFCTKLVPRAHTRMQFVRTRCSWAIRLRVARPNVQAGNDGRTESALFSSLPIYAT